VRRDGPASPLESGAGRASRFSIRPRARRAPRRWRRRSRARGSRCEPAARGSERDRRHSAVQHRRPPRADSAVPGVGCQALFRWPVGEEIIEPWKAWSMTTLLAVCSVPFGPDCRWELLSGGYATRGHIHHPRYVRNVHSGNGHPPTPYAPASGGLHRRTGERLCASTLPGRAFSTDDLVALGHPATAGSRARSRARRAR